MSKVELYKQFYFKELSAKNDLNNAVNLPVIVITGLISLHSYYYGKINTTGVPFIAAFSILTGLAIILSMFHLIKSYVNHGKTFHYAELNDMSEFLAFEKKLTEAHQEDNFDKFASEQLAKCAAINFHINVARSKALANAKKYLAIAIYSTLVTSIIFIITLIKK